MRTRLSSLAAVFLVSAPAAAQTQVWSEPKKTEVWSEPKKTETGAEPKKTEVWSEPKKTEQWAPVVHTEQVKVRPSTEEPTVQAATPIDARLVGRWKVRIPTGVGYRTDGREVYQVITPGADLSRLEVKADGSYRWGRHQGKVREVRPWFAQEGGQRYFELSDGSNAYLLLHDGTEKGCRMLFSVGGHRANCERIR